MQWLRVIINIIIINIIIIIIKHESTEQGWESENTINPKTQILHNQLLEGRRRVGDTKREQIRPTRRLFS